MIEDETDPTGKETQAPAPSTMAFNIITAAVESHPSPIQCLCTAIFHKFSALKNKEHQQLNTYSRLTKDSFLPRFAQLAFKLHATNKVMETGDFKTLAASMETLMLEWKTKAKEAILMVAQLESKALCI